MSFDHLLSIDLSGPSLAWVSLARLQDRSGPEVRSSSHCHLYAVGISLKVSPLAHAYLNCEGFRALSLILLCLDRTKKSGMSAERRTRSATLPSAQRAIPVRP